MEIHICQQRNSAINVCFLSKDASRYIDTRYIDISGVENARDAVKISAAQTGGLKWILHTCRGQRATLHSLQPPATELTGPGSDCGNGRRRREGQPATAAVRGRPSSSRVQSRRPTAAVRGRPSSSRVQSRLPTAAGLCRGGQELVHVALQRDWLCFAGAPSHVRLKGRHGVRQLLCEWPGLETERPPGTSAAHCLAQFGMLYSMNTAEFETAVVILYAAVNI